MIDFVLALFALGAASPAPAQHADPAVMAAHRTALQRLDWMNGVWRGEAVVTTPSGVLRLTQTERVGSMLEGTVKVIEGKGFFPDGRAAFNAFAIISFDPATRAYTFRSYSGGRAGSFPVTATDRSFRWEVPAGPGATIRYHARLEAGRWRETGERVVAGRPPERIIDMTLLRVDETSWPAAGGPGPR